MPLLRFRHEGMDMGSLSLLSYQRAITLARQWAFLCHVVSPV
jgi:hypothetical protein